MADGDTSTKYSMPKATRVELPEALRHEISMAAEYYGEHPRTIIRLAVGKGLQHLPEIFTGDYREQSVAESG